MMKKTLVLVIIISIGLMTGCEVSEKISDDRLEPSISIKFMIGDELHASQSVGANESIDLIDLTAPEGYRFLGWFEDGDLILSDSIVRNVDTSLEAKFEPISYSIEYIGDFDTHPNQTNITIEDTVSLLPAIKEGYIFIHWAYPSNSDDPVESLQLVTDDITLEAHFKKEPPSIVVGPYESISSLTYDINISQVTNAFVDISHTTPADQYYDTIYTVYFMDGDSLEYLFRGGQMPKNVEDAFIFGYLLGWLPSSLRADIKRVEFNQAQSFNLQWTSEQTLSIDLNYGAKSYADIDLILALYTSLLEPYYNSLSQDIIENYQTLVDESLFRISETAKDSYQGDFIESYIAYALSIYTPDALDSPSEEITAQLETRVNFFKDLGLALQNDDDTIRKSIQDSKLPHTPLMWGTVWDLPMVFNEDDPSAFETLEYLGQGMRMTYDHRDTPKGWQEREFYLFEALYNDNYSVEFQLNTEFNFERAQEVVNVFATQYGQLPLALRANVLTYTIHEASFAAGGGSQNIVVAVDPLDPIYEDLSFMEMVAHEAAHASLDWVHGGIIEESPWLLAASKDDAFIDIYAAEFPVREDIAASIIPYILYRYRPERVSEYLLQLINEVMSERIKYFDNFDFSVPE